MNTNYTGKLNYSNNQIEFSVLCTNWKCMSKDIYYRYKWLCEYIKCLICYSRIIGFFVTENYIYLMQKNISHTYTHWIVTNSIFISSFEKIFFLTRPEKKLRQVAVLNKYNLTPGLFGFYHIEIHTITVFGWLFSIKAFCWRIGT